MVTTAGSQLFTLLRMGALLVLLTACVVQPPIPIREPIAVIPSIKQVQQNFSEYKGVRIRWGGEIHAIKNLKDETQLEIIARPLDEAASPIFAKASSGRFLASVKGFLDPSVFIPGRVITVIGNVTDTRTGIIGGYEYKYPVIVVDSYYLWAQSHYVYYPHRHDPYYYDPWFPWYPRYPWYPWWY